MKFLQTTKPKRSTAVRAGSIQLNEQLFVKRNAELSVLGLGQAMVDFSASVDSEFIEEMNLPRGARKVIDLQERSSIMASLDGQDFSLNAGGSLSNTLAGLARLSKSRQELSSEASTSGSSSDGLRVALSGLIGSCVLSEFFHRKMSESGVEIIPEASTASSTGTVMVLTDESAARTLLSFPGDLRPFAVNAALAQSIAQSRVLVIEGYLFEVPGIADAIEEAIAIARLSGVTVAVTAGDVGIVNKYGALMRQAIKQGVDLIFANADEARALVGDVDGSGSVRDAALKLSQQVRIVAVTDGAQGSYVAALGQLHHIPVHSDPQAPCVDTCGAGDAYATGFLYSLLSGTVDVRKMGLAGARVASAVCARYGNTLNVEESMEMARILEQEGLVAPKPRSRRRSFESV